jgi:hypothetical protein
MVQYIIWKADSHSTCKKIVFLYGTRRFITVFTRLHHLPLSWATESNPRLSPYIPSIHCNIILPSKPRSSKFSSLQVSWSTLCMHFSYASYMPRQSHPPWFNHPNKILWSVQAMKLLIMKSSPISRHFLPLRSRGDEEKKPKHKHTHTHQNNEHFSLHCYARTAHNSSFTATTIHLDTSH